MKNNKKLCSVAVSPAALILFIILISTASAATEQNASSVAQYAYVTNAGDSIVSVIDTATNTVVAAVPVGSNPEGIAINPEGTKVYTANGYGSESGSDTISVINTATNTVTATVPVERWPAEVTVTPDGTTVYTANSGDDTVSVINAATNTVTATVPVESYPHGIAVNPEGTKVYVVNVGSGTVSVIDTATNTVTDTISVGEYGGDPVKIAVNPDGTKVYVTGQSSNTVSVIDTATNTVTATINVGNVPLGVAVNPEGTKVYVGNRVDNTVSVIDTATNTVTATVNVGSYPAGIKVSPDGTKAYVVNRDSNTVSVIDTETNKVIATVPVGNVPCGVAIGPASELVHPVANFSANPTSGTAPLNVSFTDTSTETPTAWEWNFGDRTNSTVRNPVHKYSRAGNYTVALTAINAAGNNTITKTKYIKVTAATQKPVANFTSNITNGSAPLTVQFTDLSKYATSWSWSFGDRTNSTEQNPVHSYSRVGNYTVNLTVTNDVGNSTLTKKSYIKVTAAAPKPVANFTSNITNGSAPLTVQFTDLSKYAISWEWNFGDRTNSTEENSTHKYSRKGNYTVTLTATNAVGNNTMTKKSYIKVK